MRRLMLLRHAKTERDTPSGLDRDRRLDARGREDAPLVGTWIVKNNYQPELAFVSPATRAQETWQLLAPWLKHTQVRNIPELYDATTLGLLGAVHTAASEAQSLMIVAHNPGLQELALCLPAEGQDDKRDALSGNLPTTGLVILDFDVTDWHDVSFRRGRLKAFITPKLIKDAGE